MRFPGSSGFQDIFPDKDGIAAVGELALLRKDVWVDIYLEDVKLQLRVKASLFRKCSFSMFASTRSSRVPDGASRIQALVQQLLTDYATPPFRHVRGRSVGVALQLHRKLIRGGNLL